MKPLIYFCRHGQTEWNSIGRMQGKLDSPLTALGQAQAKRQGALLRAAIPDWSQVDILASPQGRVRQTVDFALGDVEGKIRFDDRLMEIDVGELTGKCRDAILQSDPRFDQAGYDGFWSAYFATKTGETWDQFFARITEVADTIDRPTVIFAHGIVGFALRGLFKGLTLQDMPLQAGGQGCVFCIKDGVETILD